jgi:hypothetical protein
MQDLEKLLAQMADARQIYGKEPVAPYHGGSGRGYAGPLEQQSLRCSAYSAGQ